MVKHESLPFTLPLPDELASVLGSSVIAYNLISEGFGISEDGIEHIVEQLKRVLPQQTVTNGHALAVLFGELSAYQSGQEQRHDE